LQNPWRSFALVLVLGATVLADEHARHSFKPKEGYVPDERTAIAIAVAIWTPIYGAEVIAAEKPYRARLVDGVWAVEGSVHCRIPDAPIEECAGGAAEIEIAKDDGRILRVSHGK
jgi:hypothetical protein